MFVKKFLSQRVLGYSADFTMTYVKSVCLMSDGTTKTLYQTDRRTEKGYTVVGELRDTAPYVARPVSAKAVITNKN